MKIMKVNNIIGNVMLKAFRKSLIKNIDEYKDTKPMRELQKMYSMSDIYNAVDSIIIMDGYISFVTGSKSGKILRYLQYGGPNIRAMNLITLSSLSLRR